MNELIIDDDIKNKIYTIRDVQVMIDRDLAKLYGVETKVFNQAVKRNIERFPNNFRFQLSDIEKNELVTNCDRLSILKHSSSNPYVFTEQGVSMLSAILKSKIAIEISIKIINSFVNMRKVISNNSLIYQKIDDLEKKQILNDEKFEKLFHALEDKTIKPKQGIFYDGEMFDAYTFVSDLIRSAKDKIILIDNYVDDSVLTLFSKNQNVQITIYTKNISKQLNLDLKKYNSQYKKIEIKKFENSHDRFLILDDKELYHLGASLKDLGKKWFAFSKMDLKSFDVLERLET
ncbi:DNA-binding protein [Arcobacter sp. CECT 8983]|uniref:ORF6N domain-containing protein n=1 Tax=Arcobacter sp. CECT 8983 TaxID=2044508 RepID=UPI00100C2B64|nr:ORF6N domain-containing protein [Arcobacter sp. CECT 8983]RXJ90549.1 DNA-binding protein [Arcobacter sp. CECT 8983]